MVNQRRSSLQAGWSFFLSLTYCFIKSFLKGTPLPAPLSPALLSSIGVGIINGGDIFQVRDSREGWAGRPAHPFSRSLRRRDSLLVVAGPADAGTHVAADSSEKDAIAYVETREVVVRVPGVLWVTLVAEVRIVTTGAFYVAARGVV